MAPDPEADAPVEGGHAEPGIPLLLKGIWVAFAIWAAVYVALYLLPEFREWRAGR